MTTFVAWVGVDSRGPSSINFASDSRISWGPVGLQHWDMARKTFSSSTSPDIFGYVNDVVFPSMVLGQLINAIDVGGLFAGNPSSSKRFEIAVEHIKNSYENYAKDYKESFCIFHGSREGNVSASKFSLNTIAWDKTKSIWIVEQIIIPDTSMAIIINGSGGSVVKKWSDRWASSSQKGTSRAIFSSFCNAISSGEDKRSGGAPQLVSLYRIDSGKTIGFVGDSKKFISGIEIINLTNISDGNKIEWRNSFFERCDETGNRLVKAKEHHIPKGLG